MFAVSEAASFSSISFNLSLVCYSSNYHNGATTFSMTTFSIMPLSIITLSIMTLSLITLSIMTLSI
jgi:hypothetical protein